MSSTLSKKRVKGLCKLLRKKNKLVKEKSIKQNKELARVTKNHQFSKLSSRPDEYLTWTGKWECS